MKRKKNFTLIEVLIALFLFSLCALPLLRQPFILSQNIYTRLLGAELRRQAEVGYCKLLSDLHSENISWSSLPKQPGKTTLLSISDCHVRLGEHAKKTFVQTTTIGLKLSKQTDAQQEARLLEIAFAYAPSKTEKATHTFTYLVTLTGPSL